MTDETKREFWDELEEVIQSIPQTERLFLGGDFNGHIGTRAYGYGLTHEGFGYGVRNDGGLALLDFAVAYDLTIVAGTLFKKEDHLVTFRNWITKTQIDLLLIRVNNRMLCKDYKMISSEHLWTQRRLLVMDVVIKRLKMKKRTVRDPRIRW